ncbi:MAG: cadherin-like domain-containing protein, partial [Proteobacteria bacterium]|nr:cadherin-like domain-containing protein [Pseudomonadota bacterium]MBU1710857.1 cadherin-like domain-containing protein [Pseudomonadota bacterium]
MLHLGFDSYTLLNIFLLLSSSFLILLLSLTLTTIRTPMPWNDDPRAQEITRNRILLLLLTLLITVLLTACGSGGSDTPPQSPDITTASTPETVETEQPIPVIEETPPEEPQQPVNEPPAPANNPPVSSVDINSMDENTTLTVYAPGVLGNDTDIESSALTALLVTGPANGTLTLNTDGSFIYTPASNFVGTDSFTYKANDGGLDSNISLVTVVVNNVDVIFSKTSASEYLNLLTVSWEYDNNIPGIAGFRVYDSNQNEVCNTEISETRILFCNFTFVESGPQTFTITAYDITNNESAHSEPITANKAPQAEIQADGVNNLVAFDA